LPWRVPVMTMILHDAGHDGARGHDVTMTTVRFARRRRAAPLPPAPLVSGSVLAPPTRRMTALPLDLEIVRNHVGGGEEVPRILLFDSSTIVNKHLAFHPPSCHPPSSFLLSPFASFCEGCACVPLINPRWPSRDSQSVRESLISYPSSQQYCESR